MLVGIQIRGRVENQGSWRIWTYHHQRKFAQKDKGKIKYLGILPTQLIGEDDKLIMLILFTWKKKGLPISYHVAVLLAPALGPNNCWCFNLKRMENSKF